MPPDLMLSSFSKGFQTNKNKNYPILQNHSIKHESHLQWTESWTEQVHHILFTIGSDRTKQPFDSMGQQMHEDLVPGKADRRELPKGSL